MYRQVLRFLSALALVVVAFVIGCTTGPTLPIYRLAPAAVSVGTPPGPVGTLFGAGTTVSETSDLITYRSGPMRLEVYKSSGGFWFEDTTQLWNPDLTPQLRDSSLLHPSASAMFTHSRPSTYGFAKDSSFASFEFTGIRPTLVSILDGAGPASSVKLDWRVGFAARVSDRRPGARKFEVTGGGGEFKIHYGNQGSVIGYHGVWREIRGIAHRDRVIPRSVADAQYLSMVGGTHQVVFPPPTIAYYSEPAPFVQARMYPVYVYSGMELAGGDTILLRTITIPATRSTPLLGAPTPHGGRAETDPPLAGSTNAEGPEEGGTGPHASQFEVASSWLGKVANLSSAQANANGLVETLRAAGWAVNFNWGNADAWYDDWNSKRADWADATDLLFYTGHAGGDGWDLFDHQFVTPEVPVGFVRLSDSDVATAVPPGMYGHQDLEWIVIAACGPLQDASLTPPLGGDAIMRWKPAFGGLHLLLGYASVTYDTPHEGRLFARYALQGKTLVNAWLRTAAETQPSTNIYPSPDGPNIWAGAMWARRRGVPSAHLDHLWGRGLVTPDPTPPQGYKVIWSPT